MKPDGGQGCAIAALDGRQGGRAEIVRPERTEANVGMAPRECECGRFSVTFFDLLALDRAEVVEPG
jgi:hypothetical protein